MSTHPQLHTLDANSLHTPDHPSWATDPAYNAPAAQMLVEAYDLIGLAPDGIDSYTNAALLALDCLEVTQCAQQRLRAMYIVAKGYAALSKTDEALGWTDEAIDQTLLVPEHPSFIDLIDLRAHLNIHRLEFGAASDDLGETAVRLRALPQPWDHAIVIQLIATLTSHAQIHFYLSDPDGVQRLLREARDLVPLAGDGAAPQVAGIELTQALLLRQLGNAAEAAPIALRAAMAFESHDKPHTAVRAYVLLAAVYLDIAMAIPSGADQDSYLGLAASHLATARRLAKAYGDENGAPLVTLEHVRLDRMRGIWRDRLSSIQRVISGAHAEGNTILLVQALTSLGDEYRSLGKLNDARATYREALDTLGSHEITAIAAPARKALESLDS